MKSSQERGLFRLLETLINEDMVLENDDSGDDQDDDDCRTEAERYRDRLHSRWLNGEPAAKAEVERRLQAAGYDWQVVDAEGFDCRFNDFARLERMIGEVDERRNITLREIDRHREAVARRLRQAIGNIKDPECEDIAETEGIT